MFGDFTIQQTKNGEAQKPVTVRRPAYFLVSDKMELDISDCGFYAPVQSDHSPIFIKIYHFRRLLEGQTTKSLIVPLSMTLFFVEKTKEIISVVAMSTTSQFEDYRIGWEVLKYKARQFSKE